MPRNRQGFLKADALRNGIPDQYATARRDGVHIVEIVHDHYLYGGFAVRHCITNADDAEDWEQTITQYGTDLPAARLEFKRVVKSLGGRA